MMTYEERKAAYEQIIAKNGTLSQVLKALEEMSELSQELCKLFCDDHRGKAQLIDELADVTIMVEQMRILFGVNEEVSERMDYKIHRQLSRMAGEPEKPEEPKIVHCRDCTLKRAVHVRGGMIWRCPERTTDVRLAGYCDKGVPSNA